MSSKIGRDNDGGVADQDQHEEAEEAEEGEEEDEGYEGDDSQAQQDVDDMFAGKNPLSMKKFGQKRRFVATLCPELYTNHSYAHEAAESSLLVVLPRVLL